LSDLLDTSNVVVATSPGPTQVSGSSTACGGTATCAFTTLVAQARLRQGWYVNLTNPATPSERILAPPIVLGGMVLMTSFVPNSDICALLGDSFVYALYYETGTAYYAPVIGTEFVPDETNKKKADLGKGMPTTVGFAVGKEDSTGCVQTSTGQTVCFKYTGPEPRSGVIDWRQEGDAGGATTEIQTIYRHMVK
jgi:type IV pilus assembly protein PilY1